ncbi:MAG: helix-turn-helix transcriptional regulator [Nocardioidaceae bacterium]
MAADVTRRIGDQGIDTVAVLAEPVRRALLALVTDAVSPVGRDDAAAALDVGRSLAGYHLDQLVEEGLLEVSYARRNGRSGPGAGRPAKLYQRAAVEVTVQLPARDDTLVAHLLATAVESDPTGAASQALRRATRSAGSALGRAVTSGSVDAMVRALTERGYSPIRTDEGIRLRNCPFHHLIGEHLDLVCSLNQDLLGAAAREAAVGLTAQLDPQPGHCCVVLRPARR